ncbi:MAG: hypothetical protein P8I52_00555 [Flavobacteriales bacterium]|nr:hypothetical protein [Flavobacteriales bacterium]MDG2085976.1 hypothetical protein [Flavobacteriales bacterium]
MKKIILLLITLTTLTNVSYASFPITESTTIFTDEEYMLSLTDNVKEVITANPDGVKDVSDRDILHSVIVFFSILGFVLYFLIRALRRAYRRDVTWIKKLLRWKNIWWLLLVIPISLILLFLSSMGGVGGV